MDKAVESGKNLEQLFKDIVTAHSRANASNPLWWYTWLASRDRLNANLWARLSARTAGRPNTIPRTPRGRISSLARRAAWLFRWLAASRRAGATQSLPTEADIVVVSVVSASDIRPDGTFGNTYFGPLLRFLDDQGKKTVQIGLVDGDIDAALRAIGRARPASAATFGDFLGAGDIVLGVLRVASAQFRTVRHDRWPPETPSWIADDLHSARGDMLLGWILERAMTRVLDRYPSARVLHTYENNPWEHAIDLAARRRGRAIAGYLHCAVLPSHFKNYIAIDERGIRPAPDRIICTGDGARNTLLMLGHHDPTQVLAGCALREPNLAEVPTVRSRSPIQSILVLLEGLPTMADAVHLLECTAELRLDLSIRLRPHPNFPLSRLSEITGIPIDGSGRLRPAGGASLMDEILSADAVVYVGSTAVFTALAAGVPAIKLVLDTLIDDDPLVTYGGRKWNAHNAEELLSVLDEIDSLDPAAKETERDLRRTYALSCMAPPSEKGMSIFLSALEA